MNSLSMKVLMNNAWKIARNGQKRFGGKVTDYLAEAMKIAWKLYKELKAKKGGRIAAIAPWFLRKTFKHPSAVTQIAVSVYNVKKETAKAYLIEAVAHEGGIDIVNKFWAPKSVCI
ncbi:hypothetical protein DXF96_00060 [Heyndrickxia coagulans]|uniref:hypothetical protein n=1 Tax=Heyndrickxia coagulans TaxID=1398 RepID=UPI000D7E5ADF|nr:hypothetical protein [Heyndrickxia coagulans]AWP37754.1 hypothetical protein CYJ15_12570 [Heyndrickxia coagulans]QDI60067.1 hypothetical protein DXF96_00060 [Heyndrickxia coagulans]